MKLDDLKAKAMTAATKVMQSDTARQVVSSPQFQKAVHTAFDVGNRVKAGVNDARRTIERQLEGRVEDDLKSMKERLAEYRRSQSDDSKDRSS